MVIGLQKRGKTLISLRDTPGPIDYHNLDQRLRGLESAIPDFESKVRVLGFTPATKKLYSCYPIPFDAADGSLEDMRLEAGPVWQTYLTQSKDSLTNDSQTVVIDEASAMYDLSRCANVGSSRKVSSDDDPFQKMGSLCKRQLRSYAMQARNSGKNVIYVARAKSIWKDGEPAFWDDGSPMLEAQGWDGLPFECEVVIQLDRDEWKGKPRFKARINDSGFDGETTIGMKFTGPEVTFPHIMAAVTGSLEADWQ